MTGTVLAGKYRLLEKLGQGGMGSVWRADHLTLRSQVALKLIDPSMAANSEALARFHREARAAAALRSPHVVQILDHGVHEGLPFIVMELLEGESLGKSLEQLQRLPASDTAMVMTHIARAVGRAHESGIVHRDLKPDNVFLVKNDDEIVAKVLDFGIAKGDGVMGGAAGVQTRTGAVLGTPYYMSPEQAMGARDIDGRSDLWAMGVIAFECLLGKRPFDATSMPGLLLAICEQPLPVPSRHGAVPAGFDAWFARCCARDPALRFASAKQAASELNMLCLAPAPSLPKPGTLQATVPLATLPMLHAPQLASSVDEMSHAATVNPTTGARRSNMWWFGALGGAVLLGGGLFSYNASKGSPSEAPSAPSAVAAAATSQGLPTAAASPLPSIAVDAPAPAPAASASNTTATSAPNLNAPTVGPSRPRSRPASGSAKVVEPPPVAPSPSPAKSAAPAAPAAPARPNMGF